MYFRYKETSENCYNTFFQFIDLQENAYKAAIISKGCFTFVLVSSITLGIY